MADKENTVYTVNELIKDMQAFSQMDQLYNGAIKALRTRLEILNDEFQVRHARNPIHHIESRVKSTDSIVKKLVKKGFPVTPSSAMKNLNDIAGVRVVCCYINDVYSVAEMLLRQSDIRLLKRQDYIENPNYNGYRSLHLDVEIPIYLSDHTEYVAVEIQLRTVAMDFWSSLEHNLKYKAVKQIPQEIKDKMVQSADEIAAIDAEMQEIYNKIQEL